MPITIKACGDLMRLFKYLTMAVFFAFASGSFAQSSGEALFRVKLDGLQNGNGTIIVAGLEKPDASEPMGVTKAAAMTRIPASGFNVAKPRHNLPLEDYAFVVLQEEDLGRGLGIKGQVTIERYSCAPMGRDGLPLTFKDAAVSTGGTAQSSLRLKYWD